MPYTIEEIKQIITPIAIHYDVDALSLFGSYARGEADENSDIDFLLLKGKLRGLLQYCGMIADLEDAFHCPVDMVEKSAIQDNAFLSEVSRDEVKLYEKQPF